MNNFDLKKYLAEGRLLKEDKEVEYYPEAFIDIATSYMKKHHGGRNLGKMTDKFLEILGQKIVDRKFDGDERKAYEELVGINEKVEVKEDISDNEYFSYLNDLRDSGVTNMFGAGEYLERDFNLDKREAREILTRWIRSFDEGKIYEEDSDTLWADYQDIGQFYLEGFNKPHNLDDDQLEIVGKKVVEKLYGGDLKAAYDDVVFTKRGQQRMDEWMGINVGGHPRGGTGPGKKVYTTDKESKLAQDKLKAIKNRKSKAVKTGEKMGFDMRGINEGVWKIGNPDDVNNFIEHTTEMKRDYWNVVGSDEVMDGLDQAIKGAEKLLHTALNPLRGGGSYNKEK